MGKMKQSPPATCDHIVQGWFTGRYCGALMRLVISPNSLGGLPYDFLVIEKCLAGHITRGDGVLREHVLHEEEGSPWD